MQYEVVVTKFAIVIVTIDYFSLGLFASADTAYVLAYSIIMLTTDLHSPQVIRVSVGYRNIL
jgi:Sec7-like guanine-nucleotide exchange factor